MFFGFGYFSFSGILETFLIFPSTKAFMPVDSTPVTACHQGLHHNRTRYDLDFADRKREAALANAWEAQNDKESGSGEILGQLVPRYTQDQATAVATAIQWLGSEVGFEFLSGALAAAGYEIKEI